MFKERKRVIAIIFVRSPIYGKAVKLNKSVSDEIRTDIFLHFARR